MASKKMSLATMMNGRLDQEFVDNMKSLIDYLQPGEAGKITINITVARPDETNTIVLKSDQKVTLPARGLAGAGHFNGPELYVNFDTAAANQVPFNFQEDEKKSEPEFTYEDDERNVLRHV